MKKTKRKVSGHLKKNWSSELLEITYYLGTDKKLCVNAIEALSLAIKCKTEKVIIDVSYE